LATVPSPPATMTTSPGSSSCDARFLVLVDK
jgi:hypothetical protein